MKCPFCGHTEDRVVDSRVGRDGEFIRRRRACLKCHRRYTTYERIELNLPAVVKRNGTRTDFDHHKLRASMALALRKRPVSAEAVDAAIHRIEEKLLSLGLREVGSEQIGELVMRELKKLDKIGYVRFASVYRKFEDVDEFAEAVLEVQARRRRGPDA